MEYNPLLLDNQICFKLYSCAKEVTRRYKPFLDELDLTYTQYITMMLLWENDVMCVKELGARLSLDSGTLTPLLKKLEQKGYIKRRRDKGDERILQVKLTDAGRALREKALTVPSKMASCVKLTPKELSELGSILDKLSASLESEE